MLSNVLYSKRFFPYSVSNVLAGLDEDGEGWVYSYYPVGCVEKLKNSSGGLFISSNSDSAVDLHGLCSRSGLPRHSPNLAKCIPIPPLSLSPHLTPISDLNHPSAVPMIDSPLLCLIPRHIPSSQGI